MEKIATKDIGKFSHHYPKLAAIITASSGGKENAMTAAWHSSISINPPYLRHLYFPKKVYLPAYQPKQGIRH